MRIVVSLLVCILVAGTAAEVAAADQLLPGKQVLLRAPASGKQRATWTVKSDTLVAPTPGGGSDPTLNGGSLAIVSGRGEVATFPLPASNWERRGTGAVYRFKNPAAPGAPSPVKVALLRDGRVKVSAKASGITLNEASQGSIGLVLTLGATRYCSLVRRHRDPRRARHLQGQERAAARRMRRSAAAA